MIIEIASMYPETLISVLSGIYNVDLKDIEDQESALVKIAGKDNYLKSMRGGYPTIYHFSDICDEDYILMGNNEDATVYKLIRGIEPSDNQPTACKQFVLEQAPFWRGHEQYHAIYGAYGLSNCILNAQFDSDVFIWVQRHWAEGHTNMPADDYLQDDQGKPIMFNDIASAHSYAIKLNSKTYMLDAFEITRPTYTVTD